MTTTEIAIDITAITCPINRTDDPELAAQWVALVDLYTDHGEDVMMGAGRIRVGLLNADELEAEAAELRTAVRAIRDEAVEGAVWSQIRQHELHARFLRLAGEALAAADTGEDAARLDDVAALGEAQAALQDAEAGVDRARAARDAAVLQVVAAGVSMYRVAQVIGLSQTAVQKIVKADEKVGDKLDALRQRTYEAARAKAENGALWPARPEQSDKVTRDGAEMAWGSATEDWVVSIDAQDVAQVWAAGDIRAQAVIPGAFDWARRHAGR